MRSENKTTPAPSNMPYTPFITARNQTHVRQQQPSYTGILPGSCTMPTSALRRTPAGLVLLKSTHFASFAPQLRNVPRQLRSLPIKPYAHTLELLRQHQHSLRKRERDPALLLHLAWISMSDSRMQFNRRALESFELSLAHTLFLETTQPQQSVEAVCSETHFDAIVLEAPTSPVSLKRAQRWLKPTAHDPLKPESANCLETHPRERLFIVIDDVRGG